MCCPIRNRLCKHILDFLQVELDKFGDAIIYRVDIHDKRPDWMSYEELPCPCPNPIFLIMMLLTHMY